ncbi:MAG: hypothetical protein RIR11_1962 [Bacteroidota bacterium]|jgi:hypothetical protein
MNIKLFILLFFSTLFLYNCKKSEELEPSFFVTGEDLLPLYHLQDSFLCTATKEVPGLGSVNWTANILAVLRKGKLSLTFITYQDSINIHARERLSFRNIPISTGFNVVGNNLSLLFGTYDRWLADGDVLNASWEVDTALDNTLEVTQLDTVSRLVSGNFNIHFKMTTQGSFGFVHSEQINFSSGYFSAKY